MRALNTAEAAEFLRVSQAHVRNLARRGEIPVARVGKSMRFRLEDLAELFTLSSKPRTLVLESEAVDEEYEERAVPAKGGRHGDR